MAPYPIHYHQVDGADIGSTSSTTFTSSQPFCVTISPHENPEDFFVGMEECRRGLTVDLDVALGKKPRFHPWQLTGPLGVLS